MLKYFAHIDGGDSAESIARSSMTAFVADFINRESAPDISSDAAFREADLLTARTYERYPAPQSYECENGARIVVTLQDQEESA